MMHYGKKASQLRKCDALTRTTYLNITAAQKQDHLEIPP